MEFTGVNVYTKTLVLVHVCVAETLGETHSHNALEHFIPLSLS